MHNIQHVNLDIRLINGFLMSITAGARAANFPGAPDLDIPCKGYRLLKL